MEDDVYHPCQALADMQAIQEHSPKVQGKKFVMSWAYSPSTKKPLAVPQSGVLMGTKWGMDTVLAHPKGFELDPKILEMCEKNVADVFVDKRDAYRKKYQRKDRLDVITMLNLHDLKELESYRVWPYETDY